ncbi:hypothetical protein D9615_000677 [Tricholomella constricta]|uniref:Uncharacterized protein n=1 Tax=Tricholomella constricta TaxID=117010 RepID=A0A8H5HSI4_9AGAR|nr:hypothetical protein D9615_000677 [Tricholomella constricta]
MPDPLPRPNPLNTSYNPVIHSAYNLCLDLEEREAQATQHGRLSPLISVRFLGYLIVEATTKAGQLEISTEIIGTVGDQALQALANVYKDHFICCFYSAKGRTPTSSLHPSAPSFDAQKQAYRLLLVPTPHSHQAAKAKALERDHYRCVLTGKIDSSSALAGLVDDDDGASSHTDTHAAYIFDRLTNEDLGVPKKADYVASEAGRMERFLGFPFAQLHV